MNFINMTPEERAWYDKIVRRRSLFDDLLWDLVVFTIAFTTATLVVLFA